MDHHTNLVGEDTTDDAEQDEENPLNDGQTDTHHQEVVLVLLWMKREGEW